MTESQRKNAESQRKTPDREKVIKAVETCFDDWIDRHINLDTLELDKVRQFKCDALALLREQEPVKPRWTHPAVDMNVMMCGSCGIEIPLGKPNYCPWCGRAVKLDDAE